MSNGRMVQGVIDAANKLIFLCMISAAVYGLDLDKGVEGQASSKESSEDKIENWGPKMAQACFQFNYDLYSFASWQYAIIPCDIVWYYLSR